MPAAGARQTPVTEKWEMVQLATENHNFHVHQARHVERIGNTASVVQDNLPLGVPVPDATIADQVNNNQLGAFEHPAMALSAMRLAAGQDGHPVLATGRVRSSLPHPRA